MKSLVILVLIIAGIIFVSCAAPKEDKIESKIETPKEQEVEIKTKQPEKEETKSQELELEVKKIPDSIENNCMGFVIGGTEELKLIAQIGGAWARPHPGPFAWGWVEAKKGEFDFSRTDQWVKEAQKNNVAILATLWPYADWDQAKCHKDECEVTPEDQFYPRIKGNLMEGIPKSRCAPCSLDDYKEFVSKLVERYDGDGVDDMPGLEIPIKYWEVLNEPEMNEPFLTFYKGSEEEYVEILKASREAINSACPDCKIVQGGASGITSDALAYWGKIFELGADYFDIANVHYIDFGDLSTLNVKEFKELMQEKNVDKPIWVTEAQYSSEDQVEGSVDGAFKAGASKIFFTQFKIGEFGAHEYSKVYDKIAVKCRVEV